MHVARPSQGSIDFPVDDLDSDIMADQGTTFIRFAPFSVRRAVFLSTLVLTGCQMSPQRAAEEAAEAQQLINEGRSVEAATLLQSIVAKRDDRPDVWLLLGRTRMTLGQYPDAFVAYSNVIDLDRANREALAVLAQLSLRSGDYEGAIKFGEQIQSLDPGDTLAQLVLAFAAIGQQRFADAIGIANTILSQDSTNVSARVVRSIVFDRKGDLTSALAELVPVASSNSVDVLQQLRALYNKTADSRAQANLLPRLIRARPADVALRIALAKQFYLLGLAKQGADLLNKVLAGTQGDKTRLDVIAMWMDTGLGEEVIFQSINGLSSPVESLKLAGAEFALSRDKPDLVFSLLGSEDRPATSATADRLGAIALARAMLGQGAGASALAERVLAVDKTQPSALAARGRASLLSGRVNPAIRDARLLIRDNPTWPEGYLLLANSYSRQGDASLSDRVVEDGKAAMINRVEFIGFYTKRLIARRQLPDAIALLRSFTIRNPASMAGWKMRLNVCAVARDSACTTRARAILERLSGRSIPFPPLPVNEVESDAALIDLT